MKNTNSDFLKWKFKTYQYPEISRWFDFNVTQYRGQIAMSLAWIYIGFAILIGMDHVWLLSFAITFLLLHIFAMIGAYSKKTCYISPHHEKKIHYGQDHYYRGFRVWCTITLIFIVIPAMIIVLIYN